MQHRMALHLRHADRLQCHGKTQSLKPSLCAFLMLSVPALHLLAATKTSVM